MATFTKSNTTVAVGISHQEPANMIQVVQEDTTKTANLSASIDMKTKNKKESIEKSIHEGKDKETEDKKEGLEESIDESKNADQPALTLRGGRGNRRRIDRSQIQHMGGDVRYQYRTQSIDHTGRGGRFDFEDPRDRRGRRSGEVGCCVIV